MSGRVRGGVFSSNGPRMGPQQFCHCAVVAVIVEAAFTAVTVDFGNKKLGSSLGLSNHQNKHIVLQSPCFIKPLFLSRELMLIVIKDLVSTCSCKFCQEVGNLIGLSKTMSDLMIIGISKKTGSAGHNVHA